MNLINCVPWVIIEYYFLLIMRWKFTFALFQSGDSFVEVPPQPFSSYRNATRRHMEKSKFQKDRNKGAESSGTHFLELYALLFRFCVLFTFFCTYVGKNRPTGSFSLVFWRAKVLKSSVLLFRSHDFCVLFKKSLSNPKPLRFFVRKFCSFSSYI